MDATVVCIGQGCSTATRMWSNPSPQHPSFSPPQYVTAPHTPSMESDSAVFKYVCTLAGLVAEKGGAAIVKENRESPFWNTTEAEALLQHGFFDVTFRVRVEDGASGSWQRMRANFSEVNNIEHAGAEMKRKCDQQPSRAGSTLTSTTTAIPTYTAPLAFTIAVSLSWWAARTGRATLRIKHLPVKSKFCDDTHSLGQTFSESQMQIMASVAEQLGLRPPFCMIGRLRCGVGG